MYHKPRTPLGIALTLLLTGCGLFAGGGGSSNNVDTGLDVDCALTPTLTIEAYQLTTQNGTRCREFVELNVECGVWEYYAEMRRRRVPRPPCYDDYMDFADAKTGECYITGQRCEGVIEADVQFLDCSASSEADCCGARVPDCEELPQ